MAFDAPINLYEFHRASGAIDLYWRYNSSDQDYLFGGYVYSAVAISDGGIVQSGEAASTDFTVTMPVTEALPQMFQGSGVVPSDQVFLTVRRVYTGEPVRVIWVGTLVSISQVDEIQVKISCATLAASFKRGGLRLAWTRSCPHVTYDSQCKVNPLDFRTFGTVLDILGNRIHLSSFDLLPERWLDGGYIEYTLPSGVTERRGILSNTSGVVTIMGVPTGMLVGDTVYAFAGDDHSITTCNVKFNNLANYGGFPHTPGKSPFDGDPVF